MHKKLGVQSSEASVTRVTSKNQPKAPAATSHTHYEKYSVLTEQNRSDPLFSRKKSQALRNTTLEEIQEATAKAAIVSPVKSQVHTTKGSAVGNQNFGQPVVNSNFIQKNINYINKLNQMVKERKQGQETPTVSSALVKGSICQPLNQASVTTRNSHLHSVTAEKPQREKSQSRLPASQASAAVNPNFYSNENPEDPSISQFRSSKDGVSFNSRRASDFKSCEYLKPTLSSMSRAKSVVPS